MGLIGLRATHKEKIMNSKYLSSASVALSLVFLSTMAVPNAEAGMRQVPGTKCDDIREMNVNMGLPPGLRGAGKFPLTVKFRDYNVTKEGVHGCNYNVYPKNQYLEVVKTGQSDCPASFSHRVNTQPYLPRPWRSNNGLILLAQLQGAPIQMSSARFGGVPVHDRCRYKVKLKNNFMGIHMR